MKSLAAILMMALVLVLAGACVETQEPGAEPGEPGATETPPVGGATQETPTPSVPGTIPPTGGAEEVDEEVEVNLEDPGGSGEYAFDPNEFTFNVGDTVRFVLTAETEYHTFTVDALGIDQEVNAGETVEFTHTFSEAGQFELICIPHEALGMVGQITVE